MGVAEGFECRVGTGKWHGVLVEVGRGEIEDALNTMQALLTCPWDPSLRCGDPDSRVDVVERQTVYAQIS